MIERIENALIKSFLKAQAELMKLRDEEDGMETLEVIILVAVAVIIAGLIINALQGEDGFINYIFKWIKDKLDGMGG